MASCVGCASSPQAEPASAFPAPTAPAALRIMTYNVNYGLAGDPEGVAAIRDGNAELVLLQETTPEWERALRASLATEYSEIHFRHAPVAGGQGVLSKFPVLEQEQLDPPEGGWFFAWRLSFKTRFGKLQVLSVHLRPQLGENGGVLSGMFSTPPIRRAEMQSYFAELEPGVLTLIAGDFNENKNGGAIGYLEARGFHSALGDFDGPQKTWRWQTSLGSLSSQLDHLVYGPGFRPIDVRVLNRGRSDHLPVVGEFALAGTRPAGVFRDRHCSASASYNCQ